MQRINYDETFKVIEKALKEAREEIITVESAWKIIKESILSPTTTYL